MWCRIAQLPPGTNTSKFCISTSDRVRVFKGKDLATVLLSEFSQDGAGGEEIEPQKEHWEEDARTRVGIEALFGLSDRNPKRTNPQPRKANEPIATKLLTCGF